MLGCSLTMKNRNKLAHDVIKTRATHTGLVNYVTDTDCRTQIVAPMVVFLWLLHVDF